MSKEVVKANGQAEVKVTEKRFKGYSIEEIRYQRALVALQREFCKSKILHNVNGMKKKGFWGTVGGGGSKVSRMGGIASKLLTGLSYIDYAMLGMSLFGSGRKIYKFFKRK